MQVGQAKIVIPDQYMALAWMTNPNPNPRWSLINKISTVKKFIALKRGRPFIAQTATCL